MACGPCARKAAARKEAMLARTPIQPLADGYVKKKYIGPSGNLVSVKEEGNYGYRNTGDVLVIFTEDFQANPTVWEDA